MAEVKILTGSSNNVNLTVNETKLDVSKQNDINIQVNPPSTSKVVVDRGVSGPRGYTGSVGYTGSQGVIGDPGPRGYTGSAGVTELSKLADVYTAVLDNGALLIYNANTQKWESGTTLEEQDITGGQY